jgi:hypothetical protein
MVTKFLNKMILVWLSNYIWQEGIILRLSFRFLHAAGSHALQQIIDFIASFLHYSLLIKGKI